jgi:DNA ligase-1
MKVMLAGKISDVDKLYYPVLASLKLDGVRAFIHQGKVMARSFKPIPNIHVQALFSGLPEGFDGELILGDPTAPNAYRKTMSAVMSDDKVAGTAVDFHVFDRMGSGHSFSARFAHVKDYCHDYSLPHVKVVEQRPIWTPEALLAMETEALDAGYEGLIVRDPHSLYKHGRSTEKEGILLKLKRFVDSEAIVLGTEELMHNGNEATINELGHTHRSTAQAGKTGLHSLGKFCVRDMTTGVEFEIGTGKGLTRVLRDELWQDRDSLVGRIVKYKHFPTGSKDKPRHPVWLGWRDPLDM